MCRVAAAIERVAALTAAAAVAQKILQAAVDSGLEGVDSGRERVDSGLEGVDSGLEGVDSDREEVDSGREGVDSGLEGADSGLEGVTMAAALAAHKQLEAAEGALRAVAAEHRTAAEAAAQVNYVGARR
jgi:hypothetical protein